MTRRLLLRRATVVGGAFIAVGVVAGILWQWWWQPPPGLVYQGQWFLEPAGPDLSFQASARYVLIAMPLGFVLGLVTSLRPRHEIATVVTVLGASVLGALVMYGVGHLLGPPDPQTVAAGAADYTPVSAALVLGGQDRGANPLASTALLAMPLGAMCGLAVIYLPDPRQRIGSRSSRVW